MVAELVVLGAVVIASLEALVGAAERRGVHPAVRLVVTVAALVALAGTAALVVAASSSPKVGTIEAPSPKTCVPASPPSTKT